MIWGKNDRPVGPVGVHSTERYMRGPYRLVELYAGHALMREQPERLAEEIIVHLRANPIA
jgi:pimeloyl-ACP methyl ester carboxylesterase